MEPDAQAGTIPGTTGAADPSSAWPIAGDAGMASGTGAGQFGIAPIVKGAAGTIGGAVTSIWDWISRPFTSSMSPLVLFQMVGIIIIAVIVWNLVLYHIRIAAEAI